LPYNHHKERNYSHIIITITKHHLNFLTRSTCTMSGQFPSDSPMTSNTNMNGWFQHTFDMKKIISMHGTI